MTKNVDKQDGANAFWLIVKYIFITNISIKIHCYIKNEIVKRKLYTQNKDLTNYVDSFFVKTLVLSNPQLKKPYDFEDYVTSNDLTAFSSQQWRVVRDLHAPAGRLDPVSFLSKKNVWVSEEAICTLVSSRSRLDLYNDWLWSVDKYNWPL